MVDFVINNNLVISDFYGGKKEKEGTKKQAIDNLMIYALVD